MQQFMEGMQLKYNKAAEQAGVHIVGACGYDSIPADMGIRHMMNNFKGKTGYSPCNVSLVYKCSITTGNVWSHFVTLMHDMLLSADEKLTNSAKYNPCPKFQ